MKWMQTPVAVLDKAQTLDALKNPGFMGNFDKWRVKSQWLCDELNRMEAEGGFVYNAQALRAIEKPEGLEPGDENGSPLALLIYNAQGYRSEDKVLAQGYKPLTPELVRLAIELKRRIEVLGENFIGGAVKAYGFRPVLNPDGSAFVLAPRSRTKGFRADGQAAARIEGLATA